MRNAEGFKFISPKLHQKSAQHLSKHSIYTQAVSQKKPWNYPQEKPSTSQNYFEGSEHQRNLKMRTYDGVRREL